MRVLTIGHSNHTIPRFLELLRAHAVEVLADIRSQPYSKYVSQFNREPLSKSVCEAGLQYVYLGRELGGLHRSSPEVFAEGLARLEQSLHEYTVAMMCAEEDPARCHRHLLVGRALIERGVAVEHIRGDGSLMSDAQMALFPS